MSTRLLLDGDDLRTLMLRVRDEMGPDARIVRAERVRTGGIAGFFAKERYELTVEVPEPPRQKLGRARPRRAVEAPRDAGTVVEAVGLEALLAAADAAEGDAGSVATPAGPAAPGLSTSGETFADVLASMAELVGPQAADARSAPQTVLDPPQRTIRPAVFPQVETRAAAAEADPVDPADDSAARPAEADAAPVPDEVPPPSDETPEHSRANVAALLELGVPTRLLAGFTDPHAPVALSQLVRRFDRPRPVRLRPGVVVVVAGEPELALRTATQMAHRSGLAPTDVVLAGDLEARPGHGRRLLTPALAARFREKVPADVGTVIALGVGSAPGATQGAAAMLAALAPDDAWAVVDARLRGVELRRWLRTVGAVRPFDALAATSTFAAQSPGSVLNLGVPVGWVDGLPASPVVWAAVLSERLADDAHWD